MTDDKKKMTAQGSSVGADDGQSISQNSKTTIPDSDEKSNSPERDLEELYRKMRRMSDPAYLHTVTLDELMDNVFEGKSAVIENLLYTGAYILAGAPKIGKSFLVAQLAHHVSTGQPIWEYEIKQLPRKKKELLLATFQLTENKVVHNDEVAEASTHNE